MVELFSFLGGFLTEYLKAKKTSLVTVFIMCFLLFFSIFFGWVLLNDNPQAKGLEFGFFVSLGIGLLTSSLIVIAIKFGKKE